MILAPLPSLFLSYARGDDEPFVRRLYGDLVARGFDVWFDRVSMPSRALTFHQEIRDSIAARDLLVLVIGIKAVASDYVTQEWHFAYFFAGKCVNPVVRLNGKDAASGPINGLPCSPGTGSPPSLAARDTLPTRSPRSGCDLDLRNSS